MPQRPLHPGSPLFFESGAPASAQPRELIMTTLIRIVGARGYSDTTVAEVLAEAQVPARVFQQHFEGKGDCFLAAYEALLDGLRDEVLAGCDAGSPWTTRMRTALAGIVDRFAADPELARAAMVEVRVAGGDALGLYFDTVARFGEFVDAGREGEAELPGDIALMAVGGVAGLIAEEVAAGRAGQLRDLLPGLLYALLLPYVGPERAAAEMLLAADPYWST